jgi:type VI secretion system protein ImpC
MRVHLTYPRADGTEVELPWVLGVLADLRADGREEGRRWYEAAFVDIERETFDDVLSAMHPALRLDSAAGPVELHFRQLDDFRPEEIARQVGEAGLDAILHHPRFQALEAAWRGLWLLVSRTDDDPMVRIRVLDATKKDLRRDLTRAPAVDQSRLFEKVWADVWGVADAAPFGALVGDYAFDASDEDRALLEGIAQVAAAAHTPFLAAAAPGLLGLERWAQLADRRTLDAPSGAWQAFRASDAARYVVLTIPRVLLREPYGPKTDPVEGLDYAERVDEGAYLWGNAAFALAVNLNRAFARFHWCARIRGVEAGGFVENLPVHVVPTAVGEPTMQGPTEVQLDEKQEHALGELGLARLVRQKGAANAVFFGVPSFHAPHTFPAHVATAQARLAAQLPYVLTSARVAHYLMAMMRDGGGVRLVRETAARLDRWAERYTTPRDDDAPARDPAHPLSEARVEVMAAHDRPGVYLAVAYVRPSYQLDALPAALRVPLALPGATD